MRIPSLVILAVLVAGLFLAAGPAPAQTYTLQRYIWDNDDADSNWGVVANWRTEWEYDEDDDPETENQLLINNDPNDANMAYTYPGQGLSDPDPIAVVTLDSTAGTPTGGHTINIDVTDAQTGRNAGIQVLDDVGDVTFAGTNTLVCHGFEMHAAGNKLQVDCPIEHTPYKPQLYTRAYGAGSQIVMNNSVSAEPDTSALRLNPSPGLTIYSPNCTFTGDRALLQPHPGEADGTAIFQAAEQFDDWQIYAYATDSTFQVVMPVQPTGYIRGIYVYSEGGVFQFMAQGDTDVNLLVGRPDEQFIIWDRDRDPLHADTVITVGGNYDGGSGVCDMTIRAMGSIYGRFHRIDSSVEVLAGSTLYLDPQASFITLDNYYNNPDVYSVSTVLVPAATYGAGTVRVLGADNEVRITNGHELAANTIIENGGTILMQTDGVLTANTTVDAGGTLDLNSVDGDGNGGQTLAGLGGGGTVLLGGATLTTGISPGNSAGTLTINETGTVALDPTGESLFELDTPGGTNDQVVVAEADLTLGGTLVVEDLGGMAVGDVFTLFDVGTGVTGGSFTAMNNRTRYYAAVSIGGTDANDVLLTLTGEAIMGDVNKDGKVDGLDLTALAASWDASGAQWADGDLTGDGTIDGLDLTALAGNWDAVANGPIPEPATLALLSLGGAALLRRRRRS